MGKPRRPKGPRSTWEPKPAPADATASGPESPTLDPAAPASSPAPESPIDRPAEAIEAAEITAEEASPAVVRPAQSVAVIPAPPFAVGEFTAARATPPDEPEPIGPSAPLEPMRPAARFEIAFSPGRIDLAGIGDTITGYMRGEGEAAAAHMRALGSARSPADLIRLQVGEFQRAADASLTCWSQVARKASRAFAHR